MGRAPRFKAKAYDAPEAVALRQEQSAKGSKIVEISKKLSANEDWAIGQGLSTIFGSTITFAMLPVGGSFEALAWIVSGGLVAVASTMWLPNLIALPSKRRMRLAIESADKAAAEEANRELQQWLSETYGLTGKIEDKTDLVDDFYKSIPIKLYTEDRKSKVTVKAKLKRLKDGSFELRKKGVKDPTESVYFAPIQGNEITANRCSPLELTAERS